MQLSLSGDRNDTSMTVLRWTPRDSGSKRPYLRDAAKGRNAPKAIKQHRIRDRGGDTVTESTLHRTSDGNRDDVAVDPTRQLRNEGARKGERAIDRDNGAAKTIELWNRENKNTFTIKKYGTNRRDEETEDFRQGKSNMV